MEPNRPVATGYGTITVEARPEPITIDTARTAALVVDMQNDFGAKGGMFDRAGIDISITRSAIEPTTRALASVRRAGIPVVYLKHGHRPDLSDLGAPDSPHRIKHLPMAVGTTVTAPDGRESRVLIRDTWNTDILDEVKPETEDTVIYKTRYSGFYGTDLDSVLRARDVKWLIVTGATTSVCVESTVRDAMFRDYRCILLADCTGEPIGHQFSRSNHEASLLTIQILFGRVSSSVEVNPSTRTRWHLRARDARRRSGVMPNTRFERTRGNGIPSFRPRAAAGRSTDRSPDRMAGRRT